jgi:TBC1 domain family protein 5
MHELLAMIYIAVDYDSIDESRSSGAINPQVAELCSRTWAGADAWALFVAMMRGMGKWFVHFLSYSRSFG